MIHDAEALARLLSLATGGLLARGACQEAGDWLGGDHGDALKGDRTVRVGPGHDAAGTGLRDGLVLRAANSGPWHQFCPAERRRDRPDRQPERDWRAASRHRVGEHPGRLGLHLDRLRPPAPVRGGGIPGCLSGQRPARATGPARGAWRPDR